MSVAAAVQITSAAEDRVIARASALAREHGEECYAIAIVPGLDSGARSDAEREIVERNLTLIESHGATPIVYEAQNVAGALMDVARAFGVRTLVLKRGRSRPLRRTTAERLLHLAPPFEVVVLEPEPA
jgi:K+-sensing histidine kinase KdpD